MKEEFKTVDRGQLTEDSVNKVKSEKLKVESCEEGYKKTEVGIIPKEWDAINVGELVTTLKSGLSRSLKDEDVGIPCIRSNNIKNNRLVLDELKYWFRVDNKGAKIEDYILEKGDIIINFINSVSQIGKGCIFDQDDFETIYTTNLLRIKVNEAKINNKFFHYYTQTEKYKKEVGLITKPAVNQASFTTVEYKAIKFPVPSLKEQQKIAEILSTVDSQIDDADKLIEKTKELKKGLMQRFLTKGIGHTGFKKTEIGEIPVEWEVKKVDELVRLLKSGLSRSLKEENVGIPCIRSNNIKDNRLVLNDLKYWYEIDDKGANIEDYILKEGDIVINFINSISQIGKGCIFDREDFRSIYTTNILRIQVDDTKITNKFFNYYTQTERYKKEISLITKPAVNQASFTTVEYKAINFPVPKLEEQQKISNILSSVDTQIEEYENKKAKLEELKKGLMQQLLTGKIRTIHNLELNNCEL
ncbi:restriction endonuclease subunit S [Clostridium botulinum]|uniref:restriction endonuclease subunit S n=1 Tax=Clostridium botulinum TaxID=1491 RepID=UPI000772DC3F|nr:restriction endonuclease subunit S [Clostridium botulinum]MBY6951041.1 restriction endonuclease subunit S [Clostridium botulinum]MCR1140297.1 restriction endonuclease subunit S [Clostridium botulinum]